jgi:hypothetical protein
MKKFILIFILFIPFYIFPQQFDLRGSMGINFITTPSLRDYLNQNYRTGAEIADFNSAINFSGEADLYYNESFALGLELAYILNSFSFSSDIGKRELTYNFLMPTLTAYYVLSGRGYNFKLGGGAGVRFSRVKEEFSLGSIEHNSMGFGLLLRADGNTLLSGDLYANIGADIRYDLNGNFTVYRPNAEEISLDAFSVGIRLGLTYIIF